MVMSSSAVNRFSQWPTSQISTTCRHLIGNESVKKTNRETVSYHEKMLSNGIAQDSYLCKMKQYQDISLAKPLKPKKEWPWPILQRGFRFHIVQGRHFGR